MPQYLGPVEPITPKTDARKAYAGQYVGPVEIITPETDALKAYARQVAKENGIPEHLFLGLVDAESSWNPQAKNPRSSARGLGQHLDQTVSDMGLTPTNDENDPRADPYISLGLTAEHLLEKRAQAPDWNTAIKYYGENTNEYLKNVLRKAAKYKDLSVPTAKVKSRRGQYLGPSKRRGQYLGPVEEKGIFQRYLDLGKDTEAIDPSVAFAPIAEREGKLMGRAVRDIVTGVLSDVEGITGFVDMLSGGAVGEKLNKDIGKLIMKGIPQPEDITFADKVLMGLGSAAGFFIPGFGVAKGAKLLGKVPNVARWLGTGTWSVLESATEAGHVYEQSKKEGNNKTEANWDATKTFWLNLPILAITNKLGYFSKGRTALRRLGLGALTEFTQEATQEAISAGSLGGFERISPRDMLTSGAIGGIVGGGIGAAYAARQAPQPPVVPPEVEAGPAGPVVPQEAPQAPPVEPKKDITGHIKLGADSPLATKTYSAFAKDIKEGNLDAVEQELQAVAARLDRPTLKHYFNPLNLLGRVVEQGGSFKEAEAAIKEYESRLWKPLMEMLKSPPEISVGLTTKTEAFPKTEPLIKYQNPEVEARFGGARELPQKSIGEIYDVTKEKIARAAREYADLPEIPEFADARNILRDLKASRDSANAETIHDLGTIIAGLEPQEYDLFNRSVIVDDQAFMATNRGHKQLTYGMDAETVITEKARHDEAVSLFPKVQETKAKRAMILENLRKEFITAAGKVGMNVGDRFNNPDYFKHIVLDTRTQQVGGRIKGTGARWVSGIRGRSYLKRRKEHGLDIYANYLQTDYETMAQMRQDITTMDTVSRIKERYDISRDLKEQAKNMNLDDWQGLIPVGYAEWQPDPNSVFRLAYTLPERIVGEIATEGKGQIEYDMLQKVIALGRMRDPMILPQPIAETLTRVTTRKTPAALTNVAREVTKAWKIWTLLSPKRLIMYNLRNLVGDGHAVAAKEPRAFFEFVPAVRDLYFWKKKNEFSEDIQEALKHGIVDSTLTLEEFGKEKDSTVMNLAGIGKKEFRFKTSYRKYINPWNIVKKYFSLVKSATVFRENIFRLMAYKHVKAQWESGNKIYGYSDPKEVNAISDPAGQIAHVSRHLLGDYASVSEATQQLRKFWTPFVSFTEINTRRWIRGMLNSIYEGRMKGNLTVNIPKTAVQAISHPANLAFQVSALVLPYAVGAMLPWLLMKSYNEIFFPEEEAELSTYDKNRTHIIVGRNEDGSVRVCRLSDAFSEFLSTFGLEDAPTEVVRFTQGQLTWGELIRKFGINAANKFYNTLTPAKTLVEIVTGRSVFPDISSPRRIRDKKDELARMFGLHHEYRALTGKPGLPYAETVGILTVTVRLDENNYREIQDLKRDFMEKYLDKVAGQGGLTVKGQLYYNLKKAVLYKDAAAVDQYLYQLVKIGATEGKSKEEVGTNIKKSFKTMHPLFGLKTDEQKAFYMWLTKDQQKKVKGALRWYDRLRGK